MHGPSAEHPIYVPGLGRYVPALEVQRTPEIQWSDGSAAFVRSVTYRHETVPVYNLEVDSAHNYFVHLPAAATRLLVHNGDCGKVSYRQFMRRGAVSGTTRGVGPIRGYTRHGLNQAIGREGAGVAPRAILDAVRNPHRVVQRAGGITRYVGENAVVNLNEAGEVVSVWARGRAGVRIQGGLR